MHRNHIADVDWDQEVTDATEEVEQACLHSQILQVSEVPRPTIVSNQNNIKSKGHKVHKCQTLKFESECDCEGEDGGIEHEGRKEKLKYKEQKSMSPRKSPFVVEGKETMKQIGGKFRKATFDDGGCENVMDKKEEVKDYDKDNEWSQYEKGNLLKFAKVASSIASQSKSFVSNGSFGCQKSSEKNRYVPVPIGYFNGSLNNVDSFHKVSKKTKTIVLDLAGVLIHFLSNNQESLYMTKCVQVQYPQNAIKKFVYFNERHNLHWFLSKLSEDYEVVLWSSLDKFLTHKIVEHIQSKSSYFDYVLSKEHFTEVASMDNNGMISKNFEQVKDLSVLLNDRSKESIFLMECFYENLGPKTVNFDENQSVHPKNIIRITPCSLPSENRNLESPFDHEGESDDGLSSSSESSYDESLDIESESQHRYPSSNHSVNLKEAWSSLKRASKA